MFTETQETIVEAKRSAKLSVLNLYKDTDSNHKAPDEQYPTHQSRSLPLYLMHAEQLHSRIAAH